MIDRFKPQSEFSRNVLTLMTGTTIAQAIPIAISPILTRIYTPEDFGVFALYMSILMIFGSLVAGRYELAILIPHSNIYAKHIVVYSIFFSALFSFLLLIVVILFIDKIVDGLNNTEIRVWLYALPFNIFIVSTSSILYYWNNRNKQYGTLSKNMILQSSTRGSTNIIFGLFTINFGLIVGGIIGSLTSILYLLKRTKNSFNGFYFNKLKAYILMKKYIKFPKFMVPSGLLENLSSQLPIILLGSFFGSSIVGFYSLSQRIVRVPLMLIGTSIGSVFRQEASLHLAKYGNCRKIFINTLKKLLLIGTIPFVAFYFIAPELFSFVFDEKWRVAGEYAKILTPLFYLQFIVSPLSSMFMIAEKQQYDLLIQIYLVASVFISFTIGYKYFNSVEISLMIFTVVYSVKYLVELMLSYRFTIKKFEA